MNLRKLLIPALATLVNCLQATAQPQTIPKECYQPASYMDYYKQERAGMEDRSTIYYFAQQSKEKVSLDDITRQFPIFILPSVGADRDDKRNYDWSSLLNTLKSKGFKEVKYAGSTDSLLPDGIQSVEDDFKAMQAIKSTCGTSPVVVTGYDINQVFQSCPQSVASSLGLTDQIIIVIPHNQELEDKSKTGIKRDRDSKYHSYTILKQNADGFYRIR